MASSHASAIPAELIPQLAIAAADLGQHGLLTNLAESFALDRANTDRTASSAETGLEQRIVAESSQLLDRIRFVRKVATRYANAFNEGVKASLIHDGAGEDLRVRFDSAVAGMNDYAVLTVSACDRLESALAHADSSDSGTPPVSGGSSLGCDLILVGSMAGGATCVIGCGPCCVAGAAGALVYVGLCH